MSLCVKFDNDWSKTVCCRACWNSKTGVTDIQGKIQFLRHNVTKRRHNVKMLTDLESTHQGLSYDILHDMVHEVLYNDLHEGQLRPRALTMKVKADRYQKLISWAPIDVLYTHQVLSWYDKIYSKNKGFVDFDVWPCVDLNLWPWP